MSRAIENLYFNWLCAKVLDSNRDYEQLMMILFQTEFIIRVPEDAHRVSDGLELREQFSRETSTYSNGLDRRPCSILEVLISFAPRAEYQTDIPAKDWFWTFITNLGLDHFSRVSDRDIPEIQDILHTFTWRQYEPTGEGGLFPLETTFHDQREVEIWLQFCEYVTGHGV